MGRDLERGKSTTLAGKLFFTATHGKLCKNGSNYERESMKIESIKTAHQFAVYIRDVSKKLDYKGNLRQFLSALATLISKHKNSEPSWALLATLIQDAISASLPELTIDTKKHLQPPDLEESQGRVKDFAILQQMINYQIADLQRMADAGTLENEYRYFGIDSPTGNRWYNFDVDAYLECASSGVGGYEPITEDESTESEPCAWFYLAIFLWLGQIYE